MHCWVMHPDGATAVQQAAAGTAVEARALVLLGAASLLPMCVGW